MDIFKNTIHYKRFMIPYRIYGAGKTCLLCINGAQMTMGTWALFIKRFSKKYRVVLFDFPQQGMGDILSKPFSVTFDEQLECIAQVVNQLTDCDSLYTVSTSWGAVLAMAYSARYPDQIDKQIMGSLAIGTNKELDKITRQGMNFCEQKEISKIGSLIAGSLGEEAPDILKRQIVQQFKTISPQHMEAFYHHADFILKAQVEDLADLSKVITPTLLVYGEKDKFCSLNDAYYLQEHLKNVHLEVVKGVGHFLAHENRSIMDLCDEFYTKPYTQCSHKTLLREAF